VVRQAPGRHLPRRPRADHHHVESPHPGTLLMALGAIADYT
jgi:hypothetical protein